MVRLILDILRYIVWDKPYMRVNVLWGGWGGGGGGGYARFVLRGIVIFRLLDLCGFK